MPAAPLTKQQKLALAARLVPIDARELENWLLPQAAADPDADGHDEGGGADSGDKKPDPATRAIGDDGKLHLQIYGPIVSSMEAEFLSWFGIQCTNAAEIQAELAAGENRDVVLHIHSPGGYVGESAVIRAGLTSRKAAGHRVTALIEGVAVSAAAYIAIAADEILMESMSVLSFHRPIIRACISASARDLERIAMEFRQHEDQFASMVAEVSNLTKAAVLKALRDYDFMSFTAKEASTAGFRAREYDGSVKSPAPKAMDEPSNDDDRSLLVVCEDEDAKAAKQKKEGDGGNANNRTSSASAVPDETETETETPAGDVPPAADGERGNGGTGVPPTPDPVRAKSGDGAGGDNTPPTPDPDPTPAPAIEDPQAPKPAASRTLAQRRHLVRQYNRRRGAPTPAVRITAR